MKTETKLLFIASGLLAASTTVGFINNNIKRKKKKNSEKFHEGFLKILTEQKELTKDFDEKHSSYINMFLDLLEIEEIPGRRKMIVNRLLELEEEKLNYCLKLENLMRITYLDYSKEKNVKTPEILLDSLKKEWSDTTAIFEGILNSTEIWFEAWQEVVEEEEERE